MFRRSISNASMMKRCSVPNFNQKLADASNYRGSTLPFLAAVTSSYSPGFRFCSSNSSSNNRSTSSGGLNIPAGATKEEESAYIAQLLDRDPQLLEEVIANMSPEQRRRFTVAGGAYEWFGKDKVSTELDQADADKDRLISPKDFNNWFDNALKRHTDSIGGSGSSNSSSSSDMGGSENEKDKGKLGMSEKVAFSALAIIALETGLPFVGFGFLDNATMILAGDAIDKSLGFYLHCSVMASAAMGNVVSGMMGMQVHGFVEKMVQNLGLPTPILTPEQQKSQSVFMAGHIGGTIGIAIGLTLGMLPLLFISADDNEDEHVFRKAFDSLDLDGTGKVDSKEVQKGLKMIGVEAPLAEVESWMKQHCTDCSKFKPGELVALNFEEFKKLCQALMEEKEKKTGFFAGGK